VCVAACVLQCVLQGVLHRVAVQTYGAKGGGRGVEVTGLSVWACSATGTCCGVLQCVEVCCSV